MVALFCLLSGVSEVHTNYTTPSAKRILAQAGVKLVYARKGDFIFNNNGQCPDGFNPQRHYRPQSGKLLKD